ncbi:putative transposase [Breznakia sp. PF5-3]|nr:putative transposase [Breznakia sp. PF5-3]MDF9837607.1 putative transposase [Breznakia sp. PFB2-8]MDF9860012.1 putative transposase [Breznakia sp. PH5-24]
MCKALNISRSGYYKYQDKVAKVDNYNDIVVRIFNDNQKVYGTRKIKHSLAKQGICISRRRIARIMHQNGLVSVYTVKKYKVHKTTVNEAKIENKVNREFDNRNPKEVIVSDLTYVRVNNQWNYICVVIDLYNREIVGYSCGKYKDAKLVKQAFLSIKGNLFEYNIFHTDRGNEFDNYLIDNVLETFGIDRSLSRKGNPYDNAVAEAHFKIIKTEFVRERTFASLLNLEQELSAYVYWFNNKRVHSTLGYQSPVEYRQNMTL